MAIYHLLPDSSGQYRATHLSTDSLYGANVSFSIAPPPNTAIAPISANFYSPAAIYITNNSTIPVQINLPPGSSLPIAWNADPKNNNGVNIYAKFLPTLWPNDSLFNAGYKNEITNSVMLPDNGSTVLPASFFSNFQRALTSCYMLGAAMLCLWKAATIGIYQKVLSMQWNQL